MAAEVGYALPSCGTTVNHRALKQHLSHQFLPTRGATVHPMPATSRPAHAHIRTVQVISSVQFSSGQSRIPTVTAEWPGCRCLAEPPPLTCFDSTRAAIADVSTPTPWRTRPGLSRATPFNAARLDAPLPLSPLPPPRFLPGSRLGSLCDGPSARCRPMKAGSVRRVSSAHILRSSVKTRLVVQWCIVGVPHLPLRA